MDTQTFLAIAGIIATVLLGIWAIAITIRYNRSVRITYAYDQAIALTDDITQNFPNLSIFYNGQLLSDNLVLLKGYLINTGKKDVTREMVEQQITILLPAEYEWMECKVVDSTPSLKATAIIHDKTHVAFDIGLWKSKEYMKFEALAKVPVIKIDAEHSASEQPAFRLRKVLSFSHRIADSEKIDETRVPRPGVRSGTSLSPLIRSISSTKFNIIMSLVMLVTGLGVWSAGQFLPVKALGYTLSTDGMQRSVAVELKHGKVILTDNTGYQKECSFAEFDAMSDKKIQIVKTRERSLKYAGITYCILAILMLIVSGLRGIRDRRLLSIITRNKT